jgi:phosphoribosylamine-glycine ligase
MKREGIKGAGVVYFSLILTKDGPRVLEYNCRFGDPGTQVILPLFDGDLARVMYEAAGGNLDTAPFENSGDASACHAGTALMDGAIRTSGGRVLAVTAVVPTLQSALDTAYRGVEAIGFTD